MYPGILDVSRDMIDGVDWIQRAIGVSNTIDLRDASSLEGTYFIYSVSTLHFAWTCLSR